MIFICKASVGHITKNSVIPHRFVELAGRAYTQNHYRSFTETHRYAKPVETKSFCALQIYEAVIG